MCDLAEKYGSSYLKLEKSFLKQTCGVFCCSLLRHIFTPHSNHKIILVLTGFRLRNLFHMPEPNVKDPVLEVDPEDVSQTHN